MLRLTTEFRYLRATGNQAVTNWVQWWHFPHLGGWGRVVWQLNY